MRLEISSYLYMIGLLGISSMSLISSHSSRCERWFWGCFFLEVHPYLQTAFSVFGWLEMSNSICQTNTPHFEPHFFEPSVCSWLKCFAASTSASPPIVFFECLSVETWLPGCICRILFRPGTTRPGRCQCTIVRWVAKTLRKAGYKNSNFLGE